MATILSEARLEAERLRTEAAAAAEEMVQPLRDEVAELRRREESVSSNLDDLRRQLGSVAGEHTAVLLDSMPSTTTMPINPPRPSYENDAATQQIPAIT